MGWYLRKLCFFLLKKVRKLCLKEKGLDLCNVGPTEVSGKVQISNGLNPVQPGGVPLMWVGLNPTCLSSSLFLFPLYFFSFSFFFFLFQSSLFLSVGLGILVGLKEGLWVWVCVFDLGFLGLFQNGFEV